MAITYLTQASSGAQRCSGTQGDFTTLLDWAVSGRHGWTTEYTGTNKRIYKSANNYRVYVNHVTADTGDARLAIVRGCESATDVDTRTDEFPTVAQVANASCNWAVSTTVDTTARDYKFIVGEDFFIFACYTGGGSGYGTSGWDIQFFGKMTPRFAADVYSIACSTRNVSGFSYNTYAPLGANAAPIAHTLASSGFFYFQRDISGAIKSSRGGVVYPGSAFGVQASAPTALGGYGSSLFREQTALCCIGSSTISPGATAIFRRAWLPNVWAPLHGSPGGLASDDKFTDTDWDAAAEFRVLLLSSTSWTIIPWAILEVTDTWAPPQ